MEPSSGTRGKFSDTGIFQDVNGQNWLRMCGKPTANHAQEVFVPSRGLARAGLWSGSQTKASARSDHKS